MDAKIPIRMALPKLLAGAFLAAAILIAFAAKEAAAQQQCVSAERVKALKTGIETLHDVQPNPTLKTEILELRTAVAALNQQKSESVRSSAPLDPKTEETVKNAPQRVCSILNSQSWPIKSTVGSEAANAWINLVRNYLPPQLQLEFVPLISAGVDRSEIDKSSDLAFFIDRLRLREGSAQIFGTQAMKENGFLVLYPLLSEANVEAWRKEYGLGSLRDYIRALEMAYEMPLVRSTAKVAQVNVPVNNNTSATRAGSDILKASPDESDVVRVDTSLVTIDAVVYGEAQPQLGKDDFKIYENGQLQDISTFGAPASPFDIVLLLDLSGSTADKVGLIKKTTKRFIEMKRDVDRIAVITFAGSQHVVSPLEADEAKLIDSVGKLKDYGDSKIWDAEKFAIDILKRDSPAARRKAIVVMTDGADNSLLFRPEFGSKILFADLVEEVRNNSVSIFPIYLDTEGRGSSVAAVYADARRTLQRLADESGGNYYAAKDIGNLNEVYARVLRDMGRVYSLGYEPKDPKRDGTWRSLRVEITGHPEVKVRARAGYYSK